MKTLPTNPAKWLCDPQVLALGLLVLLLIVPVNLQAQGRDRGGRDFNPTDFLNRADSNEDGILDKNELRGRLKDYVADDLGVDVSRPVRISRVIGVYEKRLENEAREKTLQAREESRRVPGFGVETSIEPPAGFGISEEAAADNINNYSEEIRERVEQSFEANDSDKDGVLSENESRRIRFINRDEADRNSDGKIQSLELAAAFQKLSERGDGDGRRGRGDGRGDRGGRGGDRGDRSGGQRNGRNNDSSNFRGRNRSGNEERGRDDGKRSSDTKSDSDSSTRSRRASSPRSAAARNTQYVAGVFDNRDENKDGFLDKDERSEMSRTIRFYDFDEDGLISKKEAIDSMDPDKPKPTTSDSSSSSSRRSRNSSDDEKTERPSRRTRTSRGDSETSSRSRSSRSRGSRRDSGDRESGRSKSSSDRKSQNEIKYDVKGLGFTRIPLRQSSRMDNEANLRRKGASDEFLDMDDNKDGQLNMSEFRGKKVWTDELVEEFQDLDANGDGVITIAEFDD